MAAQGSTIVEAQVYDFGFRTLNVKTIVVQLSLDQIFEAAKHSQFIASDAGFPEGRQVKPEKRNSELSTTTWNLSSDIKFLDVSALEGSVIELTQPFEFIRYPVGGFFKKHTDRKRYPEHTHTLCIYPPQDCVCGDLELLSVSMQFDKVVNTIKTSPYLWKVVIFPVSLEHQISPVVQGTKYLFKTPITLHLTKEQVRVIKSRKGMCD